MATRPVSLTTFATLTGPITEPVSVLDTNLANLQLAVDDPLISSNIATDSGGVNALVATITPGPSVLDATQQGLIVTLKPANTNTGATTLTLNGIGPIAIQRGNGLPLLGGEIIAGIPCTLNWQGSAGKWSIVNPQNTPLIDGSAVYASGTGTDIAAVNTAGGIVVATVQGGALASAGKGVRYEIWLTPNTNTAIVFQVYFGPNGTTADTQILSISTGTGTNGQLARAVITIVYLTPATYNAFSDFFVPISPSYGGNTFQNQALASASTFAAPQKLRLQQSQVAGTKLTYTNIIPSAF